MDKFSCAMVGFAMIGSFGLLFSFLFCFFALQAGRVDDRDGKQGTFALAAIGSIVVAAGCIIGMTKFWAEYVYPLLR